MFMLILPENLQTLINTKQPWELTQGDLEALAKVCIPHWEEVAAHPKGRPEECEDIARTWFVLGLYFTEFFYDNKSLYEEAWNQKQNDPIGKNLWDALDEYVREEVLALYRI